MWRFLCFVWRAFHVRCYTQPCWCWNRVWCGITDYDIFINIYFKSKMTFSTLQVSRDCKRLLTVSVRHLSSEVYCKKGHCLKTVKFNRCTRGRPQHSRNLFHAKTLASWLYCNVGCHVFRNWHRKIWRCKCVMLESYTFRQTFGKFLPKTNSSPTAET